MDYLQQLQERVRILEEEAAKQNMDPVAEESSSDGNVWISGRQPLPEVEARLKGKNVFIKIPCENRKGVLVRVLGEVEKMNMAVVGSSSRPFGGLILEISVIAEMDTDMNLATTDIVRSVRSALQAAEN